MSANHSTYAENSRPWLQPVQYDPAEYRAFVQALDGDLADLEARHAPPRRVSSSRHPSAQLGRQGFKELGDSESLGSSGQSAS